MACPRCGSSNTWSDNLWAGCDKCGYMWGGDVGSTRGSFLLAKDIPGLPRSEEEIRRKEREKK